MASTTKKLDYLTKEDIAQALIYTNLIAKRGLHEDVIADIFQLVVYHVYADDLAGINSMFDHNELIVPNIIPKPNDEDVRKFGEFAQPAISSIKNKYPERANDYKEYTDESVAQFYTDNYSAMLQALGNAIDARKQAPKTSNNNNFNPKYKPSDNNNNNFNPKYKSGDYSKKFSTPVAQSGGGNVPTFGSKNKISSIKLYDLGNIANPLNKRSFIWSGYAQQSDTNNNSTTNNFSYKIVNGRVITLDKDENELTNISTDGACKALGIGTESGADCKLIWQNCLRKTGLDCANSLFNGLNTERINDLKYAGSVMQDPGAMYTVLNNLGWPQKSEQQQAGRWTVNTFIDDKPIVRGKINSDVKEVFDENEKIWDYLINVAKYVNTVEALKSPMKWDVKPLPDKHIGQVPEDLFAKFSYPPRWNAVPVDLRPLIGTIANRNASFMHAVGVNPGILPPFVTQMAFRGGAYDNLEMPALVAMKQSGDEKLKYYRGTIDGLKQSLKRFGKQLDQSTSANVESSLKALEAAHDTLEKYTNTFNKYARANARYLDSRVYPNGEITPKQMEDYTKDVNFDISAITKSETNVVKLIEKLTQTLQQLSQKVDGLVVRQ